MEIGTVSGNLMIGDVTCGRFEGQTLSGDVTFNSPLEKNGRYELSSHSGIVRLTAMGNVGFELDVDRRDNGNLGPFHVGLGFKRPNGLGLSIDSDTVKGGGYLFADPANHEFAGALELKFENLMVKAIGMLSDRIGPSRAITTMALLGIAMLVLARGVWPRSR